MEHNFVENFKLNSQLNKMLTAIRKKNSAIRPSAKGSYSFCYPYKGFVILKNIHKFPLGYDAEQMENNFETRKEKFNYLKEEFGINIAEHYCCYAGKYRFYTIQERLPGDILSVHYPSTARSIARGRNADGEYTVHDNNDHRALGEMQRMYEFDENEIGAHEYGAVSRAVSVRNNLMLKQLRAAEQSVFDKFVRDFKLLIENGVSIDSSLSENFLYDKKKGFSFVDLDFYPEGYRMPSDGDIAQKIFDAFQDFSRYKHPDYSKANSGSLMVVKAKVLQAIKNNHFKLTPEELLHYETVCGLAANKADVKQPK